MLKEYATHCGSKILKNTCKGCPTATCTVANQRQTQEMESLLLKHRSLDSISEQTGPPNGGFVREMGPLILGKSRSVNFLLFGQIFVSSIFSYNFEASILILPLMTGWDIEVLIWWISRPPWDHKPLVMVWSWQGTLEPVWWSHGSSTSKTCLIFFVAQIWCPWNLLQILIAWDHGCIFWCVVWVLCSFETCKWLSVYIYDQMVFGLALPVLFPLGLGATRWNWGYGQSATASNRREMTQPPWSQCYVVPINHGWRSR